MKSSIFPETSTSLIAQYLTEDKYTALKELSTPSGYTLGKAIQSGIANPDSSVGIYAGDAESYKIFASILDPIIYDYHKIEKEDKHLSDLHPINLPNPDPENKYILSTRVRIARNLMGFPFTNAIDLEQRTVLEDKIVTALNTLTDELSGNYYSFDPASSYPSLPPDLTSMRFPKGDRFQDAAGFNSDYPKCRGIFFTPDKRLRVWLNEEDQMRIISQASSSDLTAVFNYLCEAIESLEQSLQFVTDERYGYLTSCPSNIGTTMRAGVHIRLTKLNWKRELLQSLTQKHGLQIRGTRGEKTEVDNATFDISNERRLGITEVEIVNNLHKGLIEIIRVEESL